MYIYIHTYIHISGEHETLDVSRVGDMFPPERHLPTPEQRGLSPQRHTAPAQPSPPPQTRGTQSHSAPTPLKWPMLTPKG